MSKTKLSGWKLKAMAIMTLLLVSVGSVWAQGNITFSSTPTYGGLSGEITTGGSGPYTSGAALNATDVVTFTATPNSGYAVGAWTLSTGTCTEGTATCVVTMAAADITVSVAMVPAKSLTLSGSPTNPATTATTVTLADQVEGAISVTTSVTATAGTAGVLAGSVITVGGSNPEAFTYTTSGTPGLSGSALVYSVPALTSAQTGILTIAPKTDLTAGTYSVQLTFAHSNLAADYATHTITVTVKERPKLEVAINGTALVATATTTTLPAQSQGMIEPDSVKVTVRNIAGEASAGSTPTLMTVTITNGDGVSRNDAFVLYDENGAMPGTGTLSTAISTNVVTVRATSVPANSDAYEFWIVPQADLVTGSPVTTPTTYRATIEFSGSAVAHQTPIKYGTHTISFTVTPKWDVVVNGVSLNATDINNNTIDGVATRELLGLKPRNGGDIITYDPDNANKLTIATDGDAAGTYRFHNACNVSSTVYDLVWDVTGTGDWKNVGPFVTCSNQNHQNVAGPIPLYIVSIPQTLPMFVDKVEAMYRHNASSEMYAVEDGDIVYAAGTGNSHRLVLKAFEQNAGGAFTWTARAGASNVGGLLNDTLVLNTFVKGSATSDGIGASGLGYKEPLKVEFDVVGGGKVFARRQPSNTNVLTGTFTSADTLGVNGTFPEDTPFVLFATPDEDYKVIEWSINNGAIYPNAVGTAMGTTVPGNVRSDSLVWFYGPHRENIVVRVVFEKLINAEAPSFTQNLTRPNAMIGVRTNLAVAIQPLDSIDRDAVRYTWYRAPGFEADSVTPRAPWTALNTTSGSLRTMTTASARTATDTASINWVINAATARIQDSVYFVRVVNYKAKNVAGSNVTGRDSTVLLSNAVRLNFATPTLSVVRAEADSNVVNYGGVTSTARYTLTTLNIPTGATGAVVGLPSGVTVSGGLVWATPRAIDTTTGVGTATLTLSVGNTALIGETDDIAVRFTNTGRDTVWSNEFALNIESNLTNIAGNVVAALRNNTNNWPFIRYRNAPAATNNGIYDLRDAVTRSLVLPRNIGPAVGGLGGVTLPPGFDRSSIQLNWTSSHPALISSTGLVQSHLLAVGAGNQIVTLTANVSVPGFDRDTSASFTVTVRNPETVIPSGTTAGRYREFMVAVDAVAAREEATSMARVEEEVISAVAGTANFDFAKSTVLINGVSRAIAGSILDTVGIAKDMNQVYSTVKADSVRIVWRINTGNSSGDIASFFSINADSTRFNVTRPLALDNSRFVQLDAFMICATGTGVNPQFTLINSLTWEIPPAVPTRVDGIIVAAATTGGATSITTQGGNVTLARRTTPEAADIVWGPWTVTAGANTEAGAVTTSALVATATTITLTANPLIGGNGTFVVRANGTCKVNGAVFGELTVTVSNQLSTPKNVRLVGGVNTLIALWEPAETATGFPVLNYSVRYRRLVGGVPTGEWFGSRTLPGTARFDTLRTGLATGSFYEVEIRASNGVPATGPAGRAAITVGLPAVRDTVINGDDRITFPNRTVTFNGEVQNMRGTASLIGNVAALYDLGGADPFRDTIYTYYRIEGTTATLLTGAPSDAGTYQVVVRFENSRRYIERTQTRLVINRKNLSDVTVTLSAGETHVYDGERKRPEFTVMDGTTALVRGTDFTGVAAAAGVDRDGFYVNNLNAGTGSVEITGSNNYTGTRKVDFPIARRAITIDVEGITIGDKVYNGRTDIPASVAVTVPYEKSGLHFGQGCTAINFVISGTYNMANVTNNASITNGGIALDTTACARNYTLGTTNRISFTARDLKIVQAIPAPEHFNINVPANMLYSGTRRPFLVSWLSPLGNGAGSTLTLRYSGTNWADSTLAPMEVGDYSVHVVVAGGSAPNFVDRNVLLGNFSIRSKLSAEFVTDVRDTTVREGEGSVTMTVEARRPLEVGNTGNVVLQWFRNDTLISGATSASFTWSNPVHRTSSHEFKVRAIYTNNQAEWSQAPDTVWSRTGFVNVLPRARSIASARVVLHDGQELIYNGDPLMPTFDVWMGTGDNAYRLDWDDYSFDYTYNINAGTGIITVRGLSTSVAKDSAYSGTAHGAFTIAKRKLEFFDVRMQNSVVVYNGGEQPVTLIPGDNRTGLGAAMITYDSLTTVPTDSGTYYVRARFLEGTNFTSSDGEYFDIGFYTIIPKVIESSDVSHTIAFPIRIEIGETVSIDVNDIEIKGDGFGTVSILYVNEGQNNVFSPVPPTEEGSYTVMVHVSGGRNYLEGVVEIGTITIIDPTSVKDIGGIVGGETEISVIKPVTPLSAVFTAGPNPVSKNAGSVAFFWQGKAINSSNLSVFTATGALVAKVNVSDLGTSTARREVGSWNLRDTKGNQVSEGTYLIRGVVTGKDGSKERVSYKVNVR